MNIKYVLAATTLVVVFGFTACGTTNSVHEDSINEEGICEGDCSENEESCDEEGSCNSFTNEDVDYGQVIIDENSNYGSAGALTDEDLTLEDMLLYAIQDEYAARQEYEVIIDVLGADRPYTNIINSELNHISMLSEIYDEYNMEIPEDMSEDYVVIPDSLLEAAQTGVQAEINNIAMYDLFLEQDIPDDVKEVFTELRNASLNHLKSFQKQVDKIV